MTQSTANTSSAPASVLASAPWKGCVFDGEWTKSEGTSTTVSQPATGEVLTEVTLVGQAQVRTACAAAKEAQVSWASTSARERAEVLHRAVDYLATHREEMTVFIAKETGGTLLKAGHEVAEAMAMLRNAAGLVLQSQGAVLPSTPGKLSFAKKLPLGVVAVISPFNFPLILSMRVVAPALAVGNAVVLKPDSRTPVTGGFIVALALQAGGLPAGVLQVVPGGAEAGEALCTDPNTQMVSFTGSTAVGRRFGELAGKHLKKVALELGGKNSLIVLEDADLDVAAKNIAWGAYLHQGQICMATGRVLVQRSIVEKLTARMVEKANQLPVGDPMAGNVALGPLISESQRDRVQAIVEQAVAEGAKLEAGGTFEQLFYRPTVLSGVRPSMRAFREEIFGPVANIVSFDSDEEAVALANDTDYGLSAGIISKSVGRAMALGERLAVGHVHINDQTVNDEGVNPFGGQGASGNHSSMGGPADLCEYTQWRWTTVKNEAPPYPF